jgi:multiple sugar transport system permease protein
MWNICRFLMWYVPIVFITALLFAAGLRRINYGRGFIALEPIPEGIVRMS